MIGIAIAILSVLLPVVHLYVSKVPRTRRSVIHILLLYALVLDVGVIGLPMGFIPHVFFADETARAIGWPTGSPFQFEVGVHDGAWGVLGFLCIWIGGTFWLATGLGWALFMLGATYGHIRQTRARRRLCALQFPHDVLGRIHRHLAARAALALLAGGRIPGAARVGRASRVATRAPIPDILAREVGSRRVPRQPGQVRKEAALTSVSRVARPASHLP